MLFPDDSDFLMGVNTLCLNDFLLGEYDWP